MKKIQLESEGIKSLSTQFILSSLKQMLTLITSFEGEAEKLRVKLLDVNNKLWPLIDKPDILPGVVFTRVDDITSPLLRIEFDQVKFEFYRQLLLFYKDKDDSLNRLDNKYRLKEIKSLVPQLSAVLEAINLQHQKVSPREVAIFKNLLTSS